MTPWGQTLPMQGRTDQANPERKGDAIAWSRLLARYLPESGTTTAETGVSVLESLQPEGGWYLQGFFGRMGNCSSICWKEHLKGSKPGKPCT